MAHVQSVKTKERIVETVALRRVSQPGPIDAICMCLCIYDVIIIYRGGMLLIYDFCKFKQEAGQMS